MGVQPAEKVLAFPSKKVTDQEQEIIDHACAILSSRFRKGDSYSKVDQVGKFLQLKLAGYQKEVFAVMFLDSHLKLIAFKEMSYGTVDRGTMHHREVAREALLLNASSVIYAHNHPTGDCRPSKDDIRMTKASKEVLSLIEVDLVDHFIVGDGYYSMVENNVISPRK